MKHAQSLPVILSLTALFFLSNCEKENIAETLDPTSGVEQMEDLTISDSFDWSTSQTIEFKIQSKTDNLIRIASADGVIYHRANLKAEEVYIVKLTLPAYSKYVALKIGNRWVDLAIDSEQVYFSNL